MGYLTLSDNNQFTFKCPIFNADTKMSVCIKLRDMVWRGVKSEKRRGCQACMSAGKCPAAQIAQRMALSNPGRPVPDDYGSTTPVQGKLRKDILERIMPVMVLGGVIQRFSPSQAEIDLIETSSERIAKMLGTAPVATSSKSTIRGETRKRKSLPDSKAKSTTSMKIKDAAASGDLSAAI